MVPPVSLIILMSGMLRLVGRRFVWCVVSGVWIFVLLRELFYRLVKSCSHCPESVKGRWRRTSARSRMSL